MEVPRMSGWAVITITLVSMILYMNPQNVPIFLHKIAYITFSACLAYWIDRALYSQVRDKISMRMERDMFSSARLLCRAVIFHGVVSGLSLGL